MKSCAYKNVILTVVPLLVSLCESYSTLHRKDHLNPQEKLSAENLVKSDNTYAASVLTYSFGVNQNPTDPQKIRTCTWSQRTKNRLHQTAAAVRVPLPRKYEGRGLRDISTLQNRQIFNMRNYMQERPQTSGIYKQAVKPLTSSHS